MAKFPCLGLAYKGLACEADGSGGSKTIALNAADEVAVAAFLDEQIAFDDIPRIIDDVMSATPPDHLESIKAVLNLDTEARQLAREIVLKRSRRDSPIRVVP